MSNYLQKRNAAICKSYRAGISLRIIADTFQLNSSFISAIANRAGLRRHNKTKPRERDPILQVRDDAIILQLKEGKTLEAIAQPLGLTRERVRQIGLREGVTSLNNRPYELSQDEIDAIIARHARGMPTAHIASSLEIGRHVVEYWLISTGHHIPINDRQPWSNDEIAFLRRHYKKAGWSLSRIGKFLGRTRNEIAGKARRLGLQEAPQGISKASAIRNLAAAGAGPAEIADKLKIPRHHVTISLHHDRHREHYLQLRRDAYAREGSV